MPLPSLDYVSARGLTTGRLPGNVEVELNLIDHRPEARSATDAGGFDLVDGLSVARLHERFLVLLVELGIKPDEFAGWLCGKTSPVHVFWHSFDLAVTRFSGRRAPAMPGAGPVTAEAYSHEVVSFGIWAGDETNRFPAYYSYTAPEPAGLHDQPLRPATAGWVEQRGGSPAVLPYDDVRAAADPRAAWELAGTRTDWCPFIPGVLRG